MNWMRLGVNEQYFIEKSNQLPEKIRASNIS